MRKSISFARVALLVFAVISLMLVAGCSQQKSEEGSAVQTTPTTEQQKPATNQTQPSADQNAPVSNQTANETTEPKTPMVTNETADGSVNQTQTTSEKEMKRGTADSAFEVAVYDSEKAYFGTTLLPDNHDLNNPRIIEVNMLGEVLWKYDLPVDMKQYTNPGFDVELLENGNIMFTLPRKGVYEIDREGETVWSYADPKVSHDADRLENGNTLIAYGAYDGKNDAQAKEVNPSGKIVWSYYAKNYFGDKTAYKDISDEGWTHTNAVMRLANGNTVASHRNFNLLAEVDAQGNVVRTIESSEFEGQHDPVYLPNGNLLFATHTLPQKAVEINSSGKVVWSFNLPEKNTWPVRDANRLPNGNTLITCSDRIVEVTSDGEVVWVFKIKSNVFESKADYAAKGFYKAERLEPG